MRQFVKTLTMGIVPCVLRLEQPSTVNREEQSAAPLHPARSDRKLYSTPGEWEVERHPCALNHFKIRMGANTSVLDAKKRGVFVRLNRPNEKPGTSAPATFPERMRLLLSSDSFERQTSLATAHGNECSTMIRVVPLIAIAQFIETEH